MVSLQQPTGVATSEDVRVQLTDTDHSNIHSLSEFNRFEPRLDRVDYSTPVRERFTPGDGSVAVKIVVNIGLSK